ncbi:MAG: hypothetical protein ACXIVG_08830 [Pararhodobacter sp.]
MTQQHPPVSVVLTMGPGEGIACLNSLTAVLNQPFGDVLLVDHGAWESDRALLPADNRLRHLRMAPASRATARNRALAHATGRWLWVLAPGDRPAPFAAHALARQIGAAGQTGREQADILFLPGVRLAPDGTAQPFHGQQVFDSLVWGGTNDLLRTALALLPPTAPMRLLRRAFVERARLRFADDHGGGALPLAIGALLEADTMALADLPLFCRPAQTPSQPAAAMAEVAAAGRALALLGASRLCHDPSLRLAVLGSIGHHLAQHVTGLPAADRAAVAQVTAVMLHRAPEPVHWTLQSADPCREPVMMWRAPWLAEGVAFLVACRADRRV